MNRITDTQKGWQLAITFAEAGEWDTARSMIPKEGPARKRIAKLLDYYMAVAFAEGGMVDEALRIIDEAPPKPRGFLDAVGLSQVRVIYAQIPLAA